MTIKKEMTNEEIYGLINDAIKYANWKTSEITKGNKKVDIFPEWYEQMQEIVSAYRRNDWIVYWMNDAGRQYLEFEFPVLWRKK